MEIKRFEGNGRLSKVVVAGDLIYLCGQTAREAGHDIQTQTKAVLQKIEDLLNQYGSDKEHMLSVMIFIRDMQYFDELNEVYDAWIIDGCEPVRTCVQARASKAETMVEMTVIAAKK